MKNFSIVLGLILISSSLFAYVNSDCPIGNAGANCPQHLQTQGIPSYIKDFNYKCLLQINNNRTYQYIKATFEISSKEFITETNATTTFGYVGNINRDFVAKFLQVETNFKSLENYFERNNINFATYFTKYINNGFSNETFLFVNGHIERQRTEMENIDSLYISSNDNNVSLSLKCLP